MTEPMGDARVLLALRDECREHQSAGLDAMTMSIPAVLALFNQRDAERSRAVAAEAARDAALARALPEPVLMETVEQVEALADGLYLCALPSFRPEVMEVREGRFFTCGHVCRAADFRGLIMTGPIALPDLPIPTPGDAP